METNLAPLVKMEEKRTRGARNGICVQELWEGV